MMPDWSQYVTRSEFVTSMKPMEEIRERLWVEIDRLHASQTTMLQTLTEVRDQVKLSNGRTAKLEERFEVVESEIVEARDAAVDTKLNGCDQLHRHHDQLSTLAQVGVVGGAEGFAPTSLRRHAPKVAAGGGLVGLGLLLPHVWEMLDTLWHWVRSLPQ